MSMVHKHLAFVGIANEASSRVIEIANEVGVIVVCKEDSMEDRGVSVRIAFHSYPYGDKRLGWL